ESLGIVGANGAGKSTLLLQLTGINYPSKGKIEVNSMEINKKNLAQIRKDIGFVFQNPEDQLFTTSIYEDVAFGPKNYKLSKEDVDKRVNEALEKVGILDLKDRAPYRLSGGQQNLAAIATAISMEPSILIMDEPTAALDPKARRRLINLLNSFEYTKIIASHDLDMILDTCKRTIVIKDGQIAADGNTEDILLNEKLMDECNLELPLSCQKRDFNE
ncbi:MAG: energy-coupling factor ABC transporter ATP-binding protein, partial [Intestinibacter sp.]